MEERINAVREALTATQLDSLISFSPPANEYLSGFRGSTSALIITLKEAVFLCDFRYTEQVKAQVAQYDIHEVTGALETRAGEWLSKLGAKATAFDSGVMTVQQLETVQKEHSGALKPAPRLVATLREVKTPEEVNKLRAATQLAESAFLAIKSELKAGISESAFAARLEYEFKLRGASGSSFDPIVLFGARSSLPHGRPSDKKLENGDIVLLDFGCVHGSYCSDLTRTFVFATIPGSWFSEIYEVCLSAQRAAVSAVRAGVSTKDVDAVARNIIRDAGFGDYFGHGLGHGVGLEVHESPRLNALTESVLKPGMAVTIEPGIYLPGQGGVRIEDLVIVTEKGCDVLTQLPKDLEVL